MDLGIRGKTAIVCGASQGLGRACAEVLASEGVNLILCSRTYDRISASAQSITELYDVSAFPVAADVSERETPDKLVTEAVKRFGTVHILINNAGGPPLGKLDNLTDEDWEHAFHLTLMSAVRMSRAVMPLMIKQRWGRIINLASLAVKQPIPSLMLSNSLRSAVVGMAKTLAGEVASHGILINTIATGNFYTERLQALISSRAISSGLTDALVREKLEATIPLGRLGKPEELAYLVAFLTSERASYITGATIQVDGGAFSGLM